MPPQLRSDLRVRSAGAIVRGVVAPYRRRLMSFVKQFKVKPGKKVDLSDWDPGCTNGFKHKEDAEELLAKNIRRLDELQYLLYAENRRALLIVLQGMDASGKDGTIRHVMSGVNPQGCPVTAFKAPSAEDLAHDFLWRIHRAVPRKGELGIFNRSQYEDVLVVRVHELVPRKVWSQRYDQINKFERHLTENTVHVIKFFLHISKDEQLARFRARLDDPTKLWKASEADFAERKHWDDYMEAYEDAIGQCSTKAAPWHIVPANHKWFRDLVVSQVLVETLEGLDMKFPKPTIDVTKIKVV
jgi:PPK2 family polyphosphate:nucleotide phosphotransferase